MTKPQSMTCLALALSLAMLAVWRPISFAADNWQYGLRRCPGCGTCKSDAKLEKVKKTTFSVECKEICIPPVQFPWSRCKPTSCGFVKSVRVLKKGSKTAEECVYTWSVEKCDTCGAELTPAVSPKTPAAPTPKAFDDPDNPTE